MYTRERGARCSPSGIRYRLETATPCTRTIVGAPSGGGAADVSACIRRRWTRTQTVASRPVAPPETSPPGATRRLVGPWTRSTLDLLIPVPSHATCHPGGADPARG